MYWRLGPNAIEVSSVHQMNAVDWIVRTDDPRVTDVKRLQKENAPELISVTELGMATERTPEFVNALLPITIRELGRVTVSRFLVKAKEYCPTEITVLLKATDTRLVHSEKAPAPMDVPLMKTCPLESGTMTQLPHVEVTKSAASVAAVPSAAWPAMMRFMGVASNTVRSTISELVVHFDQKWGHLDTHK